MQDEPSKRVAALRQELDLIMLWQLRYESSDPVECIAWKIRVTGIACELGIWHAAWNDAPLIDGSFTAPVQHLCAASRLPLCTAQIACPAL